MRRFIVSDLHGDGNVYNSIMGYLNNISLFEDVTLYINGDLIDRGIDSADMLLDVIKKEKNNHFKIVYLGGNHELLMHKVYNRRTGWKVDFDNDWYRNGGYITDDGLWDEAGSLNLTEEQAKKRAFDAANYVSNLNIYEKLEEKIDGKPIVIVHAAIPDIVKDECDIKIKDNNKDILYYTFTRKGIKDYDFKNVGDKKYFTIIGHTPQYNKLGYMYYSDENYLNIDGGCVAYVNGYFNHNHVPLVEVFDGYLKILTFNNSNEIIYGNYFTDYKSVKMSEKELDEDRCYLSQNLVIRKLIKNKDGVVYYE